MKILKEITELARKAWDPGAFVDVAEGYCAVYVHSGVSPAIEIYDEMANEMVLAAMKAKTAKPVGRPKKVIVQEEE